MLCSISSLCFTMSGSHLLHFLTIRPSCCVPVFALLVFVCPACVRKGVLKLVLRPVIARRSTVRVRP